MKIALGNDHGGYILREPVIKAIRDLDFELIDCGTDSEEAVDYPDYAKKVCDLVLSGEADFGILMCGTGIGISIAANRHKGIRAALCSDCYSATMTRLHNDANILAMGGRVLGPDLAALITRTFLTTDFSNIDRHKRRIEKIEEC